MTVNAAELEKNVGVLDDLTQTVPARDFAIIAVGEQTAVASGIPAGTVGDSNFASVGAPGADLEGIPDLVTFFAKGGTISLLGPAASTDPVVAAAEKHSVVISEIMWGRDTNEDTVALYSSKQWIELYNTKAPVADATTNDIDLSTWQLIFTEGRPVPDTGDDLSGTVQGEGEDAAKLPDRDGMVIVDQVSNVDVTGWTVNIGQSGRIPDPAPTAMTSQRRH